LFRRLIALDETCVNELEYWVYPSRNAPAAEQFIREVLKYYDGKPTLIVDSASWLR